MCPKPPACLLHSVRYIAHEALARRAHFISRWQSSQRSGFLLSLETFSASHMVAVERAIYLVLSSHCLRCAVDSINAVDPDGVDSGEKTGK